MLTRPEGIAGRPVDAAQADGPIVLVTDEVPRPGLAGHLAVNHAVLAYLAGRGHRLHLLLPGPRLDVPVQRLPPALRGGRVRVEGPGLRQVGDRILASPRLALGVLARRAMLALPSRLREGLRRRARSGRYGDADVVLGRFLDGPAAAWTAERIAALRPRGVLVDTLFRAPLLRQPAMQGVRSVLLTHDLFHRRHASLVARGLRVFPPRLTAEEERDSLRLAGIVAAIQPEEEEALRRMLPGQRVILAGMPALPRPRPEAVRRERGRYVFVGSDSAHNVDGMRWFLAEVWPLIRAEAPEARLEVCGSVGRTLGPAPAGVTLRGVLPDLAAALHPAACAVAPVLAGSGLKIKLLDYLAHGLPVVATPLAAAGFPLEGGVPLRVVDEAGAFAAAALHFGFDAGGAAAREEAALAYLERFSPDRALGALAAALEAA